MRNNFDDIFFYFQKSDGFEITNLSNRLAVIVNKKTFQIAKIFRTSANYYEVIIASSIWCRRLCTRSYNDALTEVKHFFANSTLHTRL